jgi:hypothetical protein
MSWHRAEDNGKEEDIVEMEPSQVSSVDLSWSHTTEGFTKPQAVNVVLSRPRLVMLPV